MGYYTRYSLDVNGPKELLDQFVEDADANKKYGQYNQELSDWVVGDAFGGEAVKWYDWQKDMESVSRDYPALLFSIEGEGEEPGDIWKAWARNGKSIVVRAKIVFDEPDLDKELPNPNLVKLRREALLEKQREVEEKVKNLRKAQEALDKELNSL